MKKSVWIICILALAFCFALLILNRQHGQKAFSAGITTESSNQPSYQREGQEAMTTAQTGSDFTNTAKVTQPVKENETNDSIDQQRLAAWQAPIDFYGKVVDESNIPIAGASVRFNWTETPMEAFEERPGENSTTSSDADGLFSLRDKRGPTLDVKVSKLGYYTSRKDTWSFSYPPTSSFSPDPMNPVVFHLKKKRAGDTLIKKDFPPGMGQIWQLHHDGTPIELDLLSGTKTPTESGQLKLEFWRDLSDPNAKIYNWKLQLSIPDGGLVRTDEEFAFQAPQDGYQPSWLIDMAATNQNWQTELRTAFYVKLPNNDYGRIDFYLLSHNGVFAAHSMINPSGSRNLEPAQ